ncbi:unnamed protein product [Choristocarpus tenellus]
MGPTLAAVKEALTKPLIARADTGAKEGWTFGEGTLDVIERSACSGSHDRLQLGELGVIQTLHDAAMRLLDRGEVTACIRCLHTLGLLCKELECAEELGFIGGHQSILHLMSGNSVANSGDPDGDEAIQEIASEIATNVLSSGCTFPMRPSLLGQQISANRYPLRYEFDSPEKEQRGRAEEEALHVVEDNPSKGAITVLIRTVKERQHSQFDVGYQMWPAAIILSRWIHANPAIFTGQCVLELGSGLGLCGLVAAFSAWEVTLSDFNPVVLHTLQGNVALNSRSGERLGDNVSDSRSTKRIPSTAIDRSEGVRVRHLDWDALPGGIIDGQESSEANINASQQWAGRDGGEQLIKEDCGQSIVSIETGQQYDIIIASDHICQEVSISPDYNRSVHGPRLHCPPHRSCRGTPSSLRCLRVSRCSSCTLPFSGPFPSASRNDHVRS